MGFWDTPPPWGVDPGLPPGYQPPPDPLAAAILAQRAESPLERSLREFQTNPGAFRSDQAADVPAPETGPYVPYLDRAIGAPVIQSLPGVGRAPASIADMLGGGTAKSLYGVGDDLRRAYTGEMAVDPQNPSPEVIHSAWNAAFNTMLPAVGGAAGAGLRPAADVMSAGGARPRFYRPESSGSEAPAAGEGRLGIGGNNPPEPIVGLEDRISTRVPYNKIGGEPNPAGHQSADFVVGLDSSKAAGDAYAKNAELIKQYPGIRYGDAKTPDEISEAFISHAKNNLLALYDSIPENIRERSKLWYEGANKISHEWSKEFGLEPRQTAGALAALSPQKDWFQNVSLARRLLEINRDQADTHLTPGMETYAKGYIDNVRKGSKQTEPNPEAAAELEQTLASFRGKPLSAITDPYERAVWSRWHDEAHGSKDYPVVTPEGGYGDISKTAKGENQKVAWGSFNEIANAVAAIQGGDISPLMGSNHKVRNFYNNIVSPNAPHGDVTVDTHAIAASLLRPLAGKDLEVGHGLGLEGSAHAETGSKGMYGLHAEAYRRAAQERGILPREMQSSTWEAMRGLFTAEQKRNKVLKGDIDRIWQGYQNGAYELPEVLKRISAVSGGINAPEWVGRGSPAHASAGFAPESGNLSSYALGPAPPAGGRLDIGARGRDPGGFSEDALNAQYPGMTFSSGGTGERGAKLPLGGMLGSEPPRSSGGMLGNSPEGAINAAARQGPVAPAAYPQGTQAGGLPGRGDVPGGAQQLAPSLRADHPPLAGLPTKVTVPGVGPIEVGPSQHIRSVAENYMADKGLPYDPPRTYAKVNPERARRIADAYDRMPHDPTNPEVQASYRAMANETMAQWDAIKKSGLKVEFIPHGGPDPYAASPRLAIEDIKRNNHMWVYPTDSGYGTSGISAAEEAVNPMLHQSGETISGQPARVNDIFRVVHDYFGHGKEGVGFRADGEENAWRIHSAMYSPLARKAMTAETRGQNSWVNYGPHGEKNRTASSEGTTFADQKLGILPDWVVHEGAGDHASPASGGMLQAAPPSITAYHGSPHSFDKFDLSKIGTGEGAQAYGHGLYFAEREGTARSYKNKLSNTQSTARFYLNRAGDDPQRALAEWDATVAASKYEHSPSELEANARVRDEIARGGAGHMYEARIHADPEHFLDWDKPLSQQHPKVQEALAQHGIEPRTPGSDAYQMVGNRVAAGLTQDEGQVLAAQALREAGIPGIKYLDQGSRGAGEGSHNYVSFRDDIISILRKYGLAGLGLAGYGAAQNQGQTPQ